MKKRTFPIWLECVIGIVIVLLLAMLLRPMMGIEEDAGERPILPTSGWYRLEGETQIPVSLPAKLAMDESGTITLYNDSITDKADGLTLTTMAAVYEPVIEMDGKTLYRYSDMLFPRNAQMKGKLSCSALLSEGQQLTIRYHGKPGEICQIPAVQIGGGAEIQRYHLRESIPVLIVVLAMMIGALVCVVIGFYLHHFQIPDMRFADLACFLTLCAIWCLTDSPFVRMYSDHSAAISMISFFAFMLFSIPMVRFIIHTGEMRKYKQLEILVLLLYLNAIVQGILNYLHVYTMIQMLVATHVLLFGGVLMCVLLLLREYRIGKDSALLVILRAFSMLGSGGVLALLLYWLLRISNYEFFFECGILAFSVVVFDETLLNVMRNYHFRLEMEVLKRLRHEDPMTGLGNRLAFEEYIEGMPEIVAKGENVGLLFVDLRNLKDVNDNYGHTVGDEMVIGMSVCLKQVFDGEGRCFRLDGDEFGVVVPSPKRTKEEWDEALLTAMNDYNLSTRVVLSARWGTSFLRGADGQTKRLSDWKFEADQNMIGSKGGR